MPAKKESVKNGRTKKAWLKIKAWQHMLNNGLSIGRIAELAAAGAACPRSARYKYRERLVDLIQAGELTDRYGAYQAYLDNRFLKF